MTKINNNNLEALKVFYGASQSKKAETEEQNEKIDDSSKEFEVRKVQASALDAIAAQNRGVQMLRVDTSDAAVEKRMAEFFANSAFMKELDDLQDSKNGVNFVEFAQKNIQGINHDKLAKYLGKGLSLETQGKLGETTDNLTL